jgi:hypothetical protein
MSTQSKPPVPSDEHCDPSAENEDPRPEERSYYYDDAHGYEVFEPEPVADDEDGR